jgi:hypothetical protein
VSEILSDIVAEGGRVLDLANASATPLRLLGGVAVRIRAGEDFPAALQRSYGDLDFIAARGSSNDVIRLFEGAGYESNVRFNALHARERLLFYDNEHERQVDIFIGAFRMCHSIPLDGRLDIDQRTIPPAELLLTKLQVVEVNEKDVKDAIAVLYVHDVGDSDDGINAQRVAALCAADWGLWRTITHNLDVCRERLPDYELGAEGSERVAARLDVLLARVEAEPKGRGWRLRSRIGERKRWYELPEEVH